MELSNIENEKGGNVNKTSKVCNKGATKQKQGETGNDEVETEWRGVIRVGDTKVALVPRRNSLFIIPGVGPQTKYFVYGKRNLAGWRCGAGVDHATINTCHPTRTLTEEPWQGGQEEPSNEITDFTAILGTDIVFRGYR